MANQITLNIGLDDGTDLRLLLNYDLKKWAVAGPWRRVARAERGSFDVEWGGGAAIVNLRTKARDAAPDFALIPGPENPWSATKKGKVSVLKPLNTSGKSNGKWAR